MTFIQYYKKSVNKIAGIIVAIYFISFQQVFAQSPSFSFIIAGKCTPTVVTFYNNETITQGLKYMWDFGKGAVIFSNEKVLQEAYSEAKTYQVSLSVINGTDTTTTTKSFSLANGPVASFQLDKSSGCIPLSIAFSDASTKGDGTITNYFWDFRDGNTSSNSSVNYTYSTPGTFDIFHKITDENGCSSYAEANGLIKAYAKPVADFSADNRFACDPPLYVNFSNLSTGTTPFTITWNLGNGDTSNNLDVFETYQTSGGFDVSLEITDNNGCTDKITKYGYINIGKASGTILPVSGADTLPENDTILCPGKYNFVSTVKDQPDYKWVVNYNGALKTLYGTSAINLDLPDSGLVEIKLLYNLTGLCPDSIIKTYKIDYVKAGFSMNKNYSCQLPFTVQLHNQSTNAAGYEWQFPDMGSNNSTDASYVVPYSNSYTREYTHDILPETYTFTLIATSAHGCVDVSTKSFTAAIPVARIVPDTTRGCIPLTVTFSDSSKSNEPITSWKYIIDSDVIDKTDNSPVEYTFPTVGIHTAKLVVTNDSGCTDTSYTIKIKTGDKLTPDFTVTPAGICFGDSLYLDNNTPLPGNNINIAFSSPGLFNTGEIYSNHASVFLQPDTIGYFPVNMSLNYNGCVSGSTIDPAFEISGPAGTFYDKFNCDSALKYRFISKVYGADSLVWTIADSTITGKDPVNYAFPGSGDYLVKLTAYNSSTGCSLERSKIIKVRQVSAKIDVKPTACLNELITFKSDSSTDYINHCYEEAFLWYWKDGTPERRTYNTSYIHSYSDTGTYYPKLVVTAGNGCTATDSTKLIISSPFPAINVIPESGCGPDLQVDFSYTNKDSIIDSWGWIFGDNTQEVPSINLSVSHNYYTNRTRDYFATLLAKDIYGCQNTTSAAIHVSVPQSDFQANKHGVCLGETVIFSFVDPEIDSFKFDFGDGSTSTSQFFHVYYTAGTYTVSLTVWKDGCSSQTIKNNYIIVDEADADFTVSTADSSCYPVNITFNHTDTLGNILTGIWNFDDGTSSGSYNPTVNHTYTQPGTYHATLLLTTKYNCTVSSTKDIVISGPQAWFSFFPAYICSGETVGFHIDSIKNTDEFTWFFGDGATSTETDPVHTYYAKGSIIPTIRLKQGSCEVPVTGSELYVSLVNADFALDKSNDTYCINGTLNATNNSSYFNSSEWFIDGVSVSQNKDFTDSLLNSTGSHTLRLIVKDLQNCSDTLEKAFTTNTLPVFTITGDSVACHGGSTTLTIPEFQSDWNVSWSPAEIMDNATSSSPTATLDSSTTVFAQVTNAKGCSGVNHHKLIVLNNLTFTRQPLGDTSIFIGESIGLLIKTNKEGVTYDWQPDKHISCNGCNNPTVDPKESTTYTVSLNDECGSLTANFLIEVIVDHYLELPKAFTPNGDGENDFFSIEEKNIAEVEFKIFNRWGNLIFSTNKPDEGWDGRFNGKLQNTDTYTFYIRAKTVHGYEFEKKGTFLLLR